MRARLFFIPGIVWHITHRCHNRDFLLKFNKDRKNWLHWLFLAKKKYGLKIFNYSVTSNHIHLLAFADGRRWVIPRSIQLVASRTALEYNQRKNRSGAFWEDNYHATAVDEAHYLHHCIVYIDLNMVRAGVVNHPSEWPFCGYYELMENRERYRLIDRKTLTGLLGIDNLAAFKNSYSDWIESALTSKRINRDSQWTESIAVGTEAFTKKVKKRLGHKAKYRSIQQIQGSWVIRDSFS